MSIKTEKLLSSSEFHQIIKYAVLFVFIIVIVVAINLLDKYIKLRMANQTKIIKRFYDLFQQLDITCLEMVLSCLLMFMWCFFLILSRNYGSSKRIVHVEMLDYNNEENKVSRKESKSNLNTILA
jgi:hypothetical protein